MDVYVIPAAGGSERRLTFDNRDLAGQRSVWLVGLTYTSDGHDIILGGNGLWRIHATGKAKRAEPVRGLGFTAFNPYIRGNRLVYGAPTWDANVYLLPLRGETDAGEPTKLIASTFRRRCATVARRPSCRLLVGSHRSRRNLEGELRWF